LLLNNKLYCIYIYIYSYFFFYNSHIYIYIYTHVYVYLDMQTFAVDLNSFTFTWQFFTHKQKYYRETLATPTFSFASFSAFVLPRRAQAACKQQLCEWFGRQLRVDAGPCRDNCTRKQKSVSVSRFPWRCKGAVWAIGFHGHLLFHHLFCGPFANIPLQINHINQQNPHPES